MNVECSECPICHSVDIGPFHRYGSFALLECQNCDLIFQPENTDFDTQKMVESIYNGNWVHMRDQYAQNTFLEHAVFSTRLLNTVLPRQGRLLEIGSGTGEFLYSAKLAGWEAAGIEPSPDSCRYAKEKYDLDLIQSIWNPETWNGSKFQAIVFWHVLEHMKEPIGFLKQTGEILDENGVILFSIPNRHSFTNEVYGYTSPLFTEKDHLFHYGRKSIETLLDKAGLEPLQIFSREEYNRLHADLLAAGRTSDVYSSMTFAEKIALMYVLEKTFRGHEIFCVCRRKETLNMSEKDLHLSRFVKSSDPYTDIFVFELPKPWWSRRYEYRWASQFVNAEDISLDAACGICHPFKFYLLDHCREVYACDLDPAIESKDKIREDVRNAFGKDVADIFPERYLEHIHYSRSSLTDLPYEDEKFDKIYCVSVLEHLSLADIEKTLDEFKRVLKATGLLVLTFDFPTINLEVLTDLIEKTGLQYAGDVDFTLPEDRIQTKMWGGLSCFRAVLEKVNPM